jgi:hypothetical protein
LLAVYASWRGGRYAYRVLPSAKRRQVRVVWVLVAIGVFLVVVAGAVFDPTRREAGLAVAYLMLAVFGVGLVASVSVGALYGIKALLRRSTER